MNRVELIGGIANDVRVRTGKNGKEFVGITLVTNRAFRSSSGEFYFLHFLMKKYS